MTILYHTFINMSMPYTNLFSKLLYGSTTARIIVVRYARVASKVSRDRTRLTELRNKVRTLLVIGNLRLETCVLCLERSNLFAREVIKDSTSVILTCTNDVASVLCVLILYAINSALGSTAKFVIA
jgi:hypothetical protein